MHGHSDLKLSAKWRPLMRRLQRDTWSRQDLEWILASHADMPVLIVSEIRRRLTELEARR